MRFSTTSVLWVDVEGDEFPEGLQVHLEGSEARVRRESEPERVYEVTKEDLDAKDRVELWKLGIGWGPGVEIELYRRTITVITEDREGSVL